MFHCEVSRLHFSGSDRLNPQDLRRRRDERFYLQVSLLNSIAWLTVSKAIDKLRNTAPDSLPFCIMRATDMKE